jgi:hypothetical protein
MNKQELFAALDGRVSKSGLHVIDDEASVVGKFCHVTPMEDAPGTFDLWLRSPLNSTDGLGARKLTSIIESLGANLPWHRIDGEAYVSVGKDVILDNLSVLGIRKQRVVKLSEERREALSRQMKQARARSPA